MVWGVFTYIFGAIAVVGPLCLVYWYWKAARQRFRELNATEGAGEGTAEEGPTGPGEGA